jgi:hypothetical protein
VSALDRVRDKFKTPIEGTSKSSKSPSAGFAGSLDRHLESCGTPSAGSAGPSHAHSIFAESTSAEDASPPLTPAQMAATQDVLARLAAHPDVKRAFVTRFEGDTLIVTLAVRGVGTCELAIPGDRFNREDLADYDALLACLSKAEGHA